MYFVGDIANNGDLGIVDTKDGKIEYFSEDFIRKNFKQVFIAGLKDVKMFNSRGVINIEELIGNDELKKLKLKLFHRMYKVSSKGDTTEFFRDYYYKICCYSSAVLINRSNEDYRLYNYAETSDKVVFIFRNDGYCCVSATNSFGYYNKFALVQKEYKIPKVYPCGSGKLYNIRFRKEFNIDLGLDDNAFYVNLVSDDSVAFIEVTNYGYDGIKMICDKVLIGKYN